VQPIVSAFSKNVYQQRVDGVSIFYLGDFHAAARCG